ncbi:MAG: NAD(P)H-dependent oxidoreductase subunit E [Nitrospirae bacterium]|nr:NAD(P)H-dependent oxidoreductase subunit E [Nitrospirota bacterium]
MSGSVLVVDDELVVIKSCERILTAEGYNVDSASGGAEALRKTEKTSYDLVLTDLKMPGMDGLTLIKLIKRANPAQGIVVITGYPTQETIKEALEMGIIDYVPKPFTPAVLTDVTRRAFQWIKGTVGGEKPKDEFPPAMIAELDRVIREYKNKPGCAIPVLQRAQEIVGYLPPLIQKRIAKGLNISPAEIHSIVSFYSFFTMKPRGDHTVRVCLGTACYVKGIETIIAKLKDTLMIDVGGITADKKFSLETVRCLGACGLAPVMVIDHDTYGSLTQKKAVDALGNYASLQTAEMSEGDESAAGKGD